MLRESWDLILATSMVDVTALRGFHPHLAHTPVLLYMHENQFAFPTSGRQHSSVDPQTMNLFSAVAADRVIFNSHWNRDSFLNGVEQLLARMPDGVPDNLTASLRHKSGVIPVPVDDRLFRPRQHACNRSCPHLLWNHRWEYDKGPERLLFLLDSMKELGQPFQLSLVGEQFRNAPDVFETIRARHGAHIVNDGFIERRDDYDRLLTEADVVISTALHDFQGLAMLEAMAAGCLPLAPNRLAYPEYIAAANLYPDNAADPRAEAQAAARLLQTLLAAPQACSAPDAWRLSRLAEHYDRSIRALL